LPTMRLGTSTARMGRTKSNALLVIASFRSAASRAGRSARTSRSAKMPPSPSPHIDNERRGHIAALEKLLAGPIAEHGLRERIRTEYITLKDLENDNGPQNHASF